MELTFALTHACDLACAYCFAGRKDARTLAPAQGLAALDLALEAAAGRGEGLDVAFLGGEPLLRLELLLALADAARARGEARGVPVRLEVTTNGTRLTPERARALDARGVHVAVSVDGVAEAHDAARPTAGGGPSWAAAARGLDAALAACRAVSTITVVDPRTVRRLDDGVAWLVGRGVRDLTLNPAWSSTWTDDDLAAWAEQYARLAGRWADAHRRDDPFVLSTIDPPVRARVVGAVGGSGSACGRGSLAVAPSGRLYGCGRAIGEDPAAPEDGRGWLGCVERGVDPARAAAADALAAAPAPAECAVCPLRGRCASACACANRESSGDPATPGALLCWHERLRIPLADRAAAALFAERAPSFLRRFYGAAVADRAARGARPLEVIA